MTSAAPIWLCPDQVFDGRSLLGGRALLVADGLVMAVEPVASLPPSARRRAIPGVLTPGYVDLQVNGGGDVLLNNAPSAAGIAAIASAHRRLGTAAILPTVITDAPETLARAGEAAIAAKGGPGQIGLHIEGPHIAAARRGAHNAEFIRPMDARTLALVERLRAEGLAVMITVAPEAVGPGDIARLAATGAVVSLGHSDATAGAGQAGLAEGARAFTHLYNAMSPMLGRAPRCDRGGDKFDGVLRLHLRRASCCR